MIKILFIRSPNAFLPEINAYVNYFNQYEGFKAFDSVELNNEYNINDFDVIWEFKGFGGTKASNKIIIHDYPSLSTGIMPHFKNLIKQKFNPRPDLRIFLNSYVKDGFNFKDKVDYCFRDMGIDESFLNIKPSSKEYDYVYIGSICKGREIDRLLTSFVKSSKENLLLIGNVQDELYKEFKNYKNLAFTGKVSYEEVPSLASKAIYGLNYMPDKYPFNLQTSTKLLEYLALGLKVITTDYFWVREFERQNNLCFFRINAKRPFINTIDLKNFEFTNNFDVDKFKWQTILDESKVKDKIIQLVKQ